MSARYAEGTAVPVARSRAEIEDTVSRFTGGAGAANFTSSIGTDRAAIAFRAHGRLVRFDLPLPKLEDFNHFQRRGHKVRATELQRQQAFEAECRRRWRSLALVIKAKLEAVSTGITSFEREFLGHIVLPGGQTVGEWAAPQLAEAYAAGKPMPPLLGPGSGGES